MSNLTILPYGSKVTVTGVDMFGYHGRDLHPEESDVGFLGVVVANYVAVFNCTGCLIDSRENVLGGTEFVDFHGDEIPHGSQPVEVCYKVRAADGRELELMNHEIEAI